MRIATSLMLILLAGCAPTASAVRPGDPKKVMASTQEAQQIQLIARQASTMAEQKCEPLRLRQPSWEEERAIGQELAVMVAAKSGRFYLDGATQTDPNKLTLPLTLPEGGKNAVSARVAIVGKNLAHYSARPSLPWVFGVLENDTPNAFSTPGGYVFVTTGLLKKMTNEAQLAGVLGHEISHVVHKHMLSRYVAALVQQCIAANYALYLIENGGPKSPALDEVARYARKFSASLDLGTAEGGFRKFLMDIVLSLALMANERDAEFETDKGALELLSFAGYDALEYEKFLVDLAQPHHPPAVERAAKLEALRKGELMEFVQGTAKPDLVKVFAPLHTPAP